MSTAACGLRAGAGRAALALLAAALATAPPAARAGMPPSRSQVLLTMCPSRESLRASLLDYADSIQASKPPYAGEGLTFAGHSYARASMRDSAILCFRRAVATRGDDDEATALADELFMRRAPGDLEAVTAFLDSIARSAQGESGLAQYGYQARLAWAKLLADSTQRAYELFKPLDKYLDLDPVWGYRMARAFTEAGDPKRALAALRPLAIACREQDQDVMDLADRAFAPFGVKSRLEGDISRAIATRDKSEGTLIQAMGGRRVRFRAEDDFALGGVVAPLDDKRRRAAVVLVAPGDTLESYDSLTVALGKSGWAVLLMEVRGSGWSAGPECPFPAQWIGHENAMQTLCAHDVRDGLRALSLTARIDTSRYLVAGVGATVPIAVEAAELDARVPALLLMSPAPAAVERGTLRERIRRLQRPIYFSNAPEDYLRFEMIDTFYQVGDRPRSRVADVSAAGTGARPFRGDRAAVQRLVKWLDETIPARPPAASGSGKSR